MDWQMSDLVKPSTSPMLKRRTLSIAGPPQSLNPNPVREVALNLRRKLKSALETLTDFHLHP